MAMSGTQRLLTRFVPRSWAAAMEAESKTWLVRCLNCGHERSVWAMGGVRWKASGTSRVHVRCPNCGARGWHTIYRPDDAKT